MRKYSVFAIAREAMRGHRGWPQQWPSPEPKKNYDVIIVGAGGHGLGTAYYLAKEHGITNVAALEKGWLGGGNTGRNTTIIRSNYLYDESAGIYDHSVKLWDGLSQDLNYNVMYSPRGVMMLAHNVHDVQVFKRHIHANRLNGVDNGKIWFNNVKVPRKNLLDKYGEIQEDGSYFSSIKNPNKRFFTMLGTLVGGRICVARGALGGSKMALAIAVKHALNRRQFNDNVKVQEDLIMDYPTHQIRLTPAIAGAYVYHFTLDEMMERYSDESQPDKRVIETQVAGLKSIITWFANETIQECREACGGKGYLLENRIADLKGDVDIFTTFEGDNTVLLQLAAKGILSDFRAEFNSAGFASVLKLLQTQLSDKLTAINPLYSNKVDAEHLYNPKFHKHAFDYRTRRLTYTLAMRIRNYIKKGIPSYQAFLKVQTHLLALGKAYSVELAYSIYCERYQNVTDVKYRGLLEKLGCLYALDQINSDARWYLEQGYIGSTKSKAIRQRVERLSTELRPHIEVLVDGFGIPSHCLTAPIAQQG